MESTKFAETMDGRENYQITPEYPEPIAVKFQVAAITGTHGIRPQDKKKYWNAAHYDLMKALVPIRKKWSDQQKVKSIEAKKELG